MVCDRVCSASLILVRVCYSSCESLLFGSSLSQLIPVRQFNNTRARDVALKISWSAAMHRWWDTESQFHTRFEVRVIEDLKHVHDQVKSMSYPVVVVHWGSTTQDGLSRSEFRRSLRGWRIRGW